jgi:hypothetical protein
VAYNAAGDYKPLLLWLGKAMQLGWVDPVSQYESLATAVRTLAEGRLKFRTRMDDATFALTRWQAEDFPERIRERARKVLSVRSAVRKDYIGGCLFQFNLLTLKERRALIGDIIALYTACLLDLGKLADFAEIVYPKDR